MAFVRPLLDPSPRPPPVPGSLPPPSADLPRPIAEPPIGSDLSQNPFDSSSRLSNASARLRVDYNSGDRVLFPEPGSADSFRRVSGSRTAVRHGSGAESDRFGVASLREISDEDARFVYIGDPARTNERFQFTGNSIRTGKYSVFTFIPRNLFEQFHRVAYIYFLIIAILNQLPSSPSSDGYEDWRRHRADRIENNRTAYVLSDGEFRPKLWKDVRVGEIIRVRSNESLPCDMVLLSTSDPTGVAYVQTINLDGESNLKTRYAKQETLSKVPEKDPVTGVIRCEQPNRNIYGFHANMDIQGKKVSLGASNIVLRGCEIKNTAWVVGVAVYAGRETKVMLNSSGAPSKRSRLETHMNRETMLLAFILVAMCSIVSIFAGIWLRNHKDELDYSPYFRKKDFSEKEEENYNYDGIGAEVAYRFLMSIIVFQIMIPISLYISMELVRLGQAYLMIQDRNLFDETTNSRLQCRALNINEDLGQIKYVFSDKTGTLTQNKMEFQCASISGVDYQAEMDPLSADHADCSVRVGDQFWRPKMRVNVNTDLVKLLRSGHGREERKYVYDFFLALSACNTINSKLIDYQGESPDEQALVYAAAAYGFVLVERTSGHIVVDILGNRQRFDILGLHEFDSDRKRMSVIVGCPDKTVKLFVKGADNSMLGVLEESLDLDVVQATKNHLHAYSSLGLRTLVVGIRELTGGEFHEWKSSYERASTTLFGRSKALRLVASNVESHLHILGASGIEDKLQDGVPEAIESLREAGIKVWVLTGDKQETAISIGFSCKLLTTNMDQIVINSHSKEACRRSLEDAMAMSRKHLQMVHDAGRISLALIIDGTSLVHILENELEEELFKVATACDVVLCCRVSRTEDMTLAIGDGANDVSMIQMADVGIGISGQEGRQAVMASDFAMGQFRFLVPLLLVHGHWNYQRMSYMIVYNFYRNAVFVFVLFWYILYTGFSLSTAITEWSSVLYSIIYTALPTIVVGILDKDLSRKTLLKYPQLYGAGQREEGYNLNVFLLTMVDTIWQSAAIYFIPYLAYRNSTVDGSSIGNIWTLGVVILVNVHLAMDLFRWTWISHVVIWGCIVATWICVIVIDSSLSCPASALFWLCLLGILVVGMIPRFALKSFRGYFFPSDIRIGRELEKAGGYYEAVAGSIEMRPVVGAGGARS
ncbi:unnamed protein product [Spirodela intermedia]|uniref:Phospholipid-transporting ATPase n=1 Tax=Spirodela intermedia TaxID=51605 RepID=A0A7I8IBT9_SPIIN|nr:unnamed protein product [Spirodela intermedia]CAA6654512.1 unnamed protein product [Spirodela intermedia]